MTCKPDHQGIYEVVHTDGKEPKEIVFTTELPEKEVRQAFAKIAWILGLAAIKERLEEMEGGRAERPSSTLLEVTNDPPLREEQDAETS